MKITVLAGGTSTERDISIVSGTQVAKALRARGHKVALVDVFGGVAEAASGQTADAAACVSEGTAACTAAGEAQGTSAGTWFDALAAVDPDETARQIHAFDARLAQMQAARTAERTGFFGPGVLELCREADVVFMALHGSNGEDGKIQAAFELMGIPFTGSNYLGSALSMDKEISKQLFRENGVPTPAGIVLYKWELEKETNGENTHRADTHDGNMHFAGMYRADMLRADKNGVGLPCVVKPACGGSSVGVSVARTQAEYEKAVEEGFAYEDVLIVEQFIEGREFSVGIVDGEAYPVIEIAPISGFYDYHNKYAAGSTVETCPAQVSEEITRCIQAAALQAWEALRVDGYGRVDVMMDRDEKVYCLEMNTLPGMTPTSLLPQEAAVLGMDFGALCEKLIEVSLRR